MDIGERHMGMDMDMAHGGHGTWTWRVHMHVHVASIRIRARPVQPPIAPRRYEAFQLWADDYVSNMLAPIDNYISRGTETFLTAEGGAYVGMVVSICRQVRTAAPPQRHRSATAAPPTSHRAQCRRHDIAAWRDHRA